MIERLLLRTRFRLLHLNLFELHFTKGIPCQFQTRSTIISACSLANWASESCKAIRRFKTQMILYRLGWPPCFESRSLPKLSPRWVLRKSGRGNVVLQ